MESITSILHRKPTLLAQPFLVKRIHLRPGEFLSAIPAVRLVAGKQLMHHHALLGREVFGAVAQDAVEDGALLVVGVELVLDDRFGEVMEAFHLEGSFGDGVVEIGACIEWTFHNRKLGKRVPVAGELRFFTSGECNTKTQSSMYDVLEVLRKQREQRETTR